jgi:hypothetical protein
MKKKLQLSLESFLYGKFSYLSYKKLLSGLSENEVRTIAFRELEYADFITLIKMLVVEDNNELPSLEEEKKVELDLSEFLTRFYRGQYGGTALKINAIKDLRNLSLVRGTSEFDCFSLLLAKDIVLKIFERHEDPTFHIVLEVQKMVESFYGENVKVIIR